MSTSCDSTITPADDLQRAIDDATEGQVVCLSAGSYDGPVKIQRAVTLRGTDGATKVTIDGMGSGPVVAVQPGGKVRLVGLTLTNGDAELGGGLQVHDQAEVTLIDCVLRGLTAQARGGAIHVEDGKLQATRTRFVGNRAKTGGAVAVDGNGDAVFDSCLFSGNQGGRGAALSAHASAKVKVSGASFFDNHGGDGDIDVRGTMSQSPSVSLADSLLARGVVGRPPGAVTVTRCAFGPDAAGFAPDGGNVQGALALDQDGRPGTTSVARGISAAGGQTVDGRKRPETQATAGALEASLP